MENVLEVAGYICRRYQETYGQKIDEMKLQKMMYFAQREALIQTNKPIFDATFHGWKYGPVLKELRAPYQNDTLTDAAPIEAEGEFKAIMDTVFSEYAEMDSFSLTRLTHGEISWKKSRKGVAPAQNSDVEMSLNDIRADARRIRERREMLAQQNLL